MSKGLTAQETIQEHPLQAIVLGDSWGEEARWGPLVRRDSSDEEEDDEGVSLGEQRPWCLLPMLNIPLLSWTLECLVASGVQQAFVFVREGSDQVRDWLSTSSFTSPHSPILIVLRPTQAMTPGDVLREVDSLGILAPTDFLVVQAGYVGNVDLKQKVAEFTERRNTESSLSMSCVVAPRKTATSSKFAVHVLSPDAQLYHYEESTFFPKLKQALLPRFAFGPKDITVRADLESIGVAICNVEVPALFTENFDYQFFYPDFVNGILTSDLLGKTICCTIIDEDASERKGSRKSASWGAAVGNTRSYDSISKAILSRKAYPFTPDENLPDDADRYEQRSARVYYGADLNLSRTCTIGSTSLLGANTTVGLASTISHSVLSPHVTIGSSCTISNSYIFEGATIADHCLIRDSIIGEHAKVGEGSSVIGGSLVGAGCSLGKGARLEKNNVSLEEWEVEEDVEVGASSLGEGHSAFFWPSDEAAAVAVDTDDDDDDEMDPRNLSMSRIGAQFETLHISYSSSSLSTLSRSSSSSSLASDAEQSDGEPPAIAGIDGLLTELSPQSDFLSECSASLDRSFAEGHTVENAVIEIKTLRMASNVPLALVRDFVIPYVLARCDGATRAEAMIARWGGLISSLTGSEEEEMSAGLLCAQKYVAENGGDLRFFSRVLKAFYEQDVVTEEAVFAWYKSAASRNVGGEAGKKLWAGAKPFVEALLEEDSDEDESD